MTNTPVTTPPRVGSHVSPQAPGGMVQLAKVVENKFHEGNWFTLVRWIDIRRDAEWLPSIVIPPERATS